MWNSVLLLRILLSAADDEEDGIPCAQVKLLERGGHAHASVAEFLNKAVEAPPAAAVGNAVRLLQDIGAFEPGSETLTVRRSSLCACAKFGMHACLYPGCMHVGHCRI
jgi:hypothetical protein